MKTSTPAPSSDINTFLSKIKNLEKGEALDLSSAEDLSLAVMNLIAIEEHLFFTSEKTGKSEYLGILIEIREMRKKLMKQLVAEGEGELWCTSKHLLAGCMRLFEVGTKALSQGNQKRAKEFFEMSYQLYNLFWGLKLGITNLSNVPNIPNLPNSEAGQDKSPSARRSLGEGGLLSTLKEIQESDTPSLSKLGQMVKAIVDCCRE